MNKSTCQINVYTSSDGLIQLTQKPEGYDVPLTIEVSPDQVDLLIQWLQEAKKELQSIKQ